MEFEYARNKQADLINSAWYFLLFLANQGKLFSGSGGGVSAVSLLSIFLFSLILVLVYAFIVYFITNDPFLKNIVLIFFLYGSTIWSKQERIKESAQCTITKSKQQSAVDNVSSGVLV